MDRDRFNQGLNPLYNYQRQIGGGIGNGMGGQYDNPLNPLYDYQRDIRGSMRSSYDNSYDRQEEIKEVKNDIRNSHQAAQIDILDIRQQITDLKATDKKLKATVKELKATVEELKDMILYAPGGPMYDQAHQNYSKNAEKQQ